MSLKSSGIMFLVILAAALIANLLTLKIAASQVQSSLATAKSSNPILNLIGL